MCWQGGVLSAFWKTEYKCKDSCTFVGSSHLVGGLLGPTFFRDSVRFISQLIGDGHDSNFTILGTETMVHWGAKLPFRKQTVASMYWSAWESL